MPCGVGVGDGAEGLSVFEQTDSAGVGAVGWLSMFEQMALSVLEQWALSLLEQWAL